MALTLVTTVAGSTSNSYVTTAYCDAYWEQHYSATKAALWSALSDVQKVSALINACRVIETGRFTVPVSPYNESFYHHDTRQGKMIVMYPEDYQPIKSDSTQNLQFPRNIDRDSTTGDLFIPEAVQLAQCEQAVYLLAFDDSVLSNKLQGIATDSVGVGNLRMSQEYSGQGTALAPMAVEHLRPFFITNTKLRRA